jgi:hypothetical protein
MDWVAGRYCTDQPPRKMGVEPVLWSSMKSFL